LPAQSGTDTVPISRINLPPSIHDLVDELIQSLPATEFTGRLADQVKEAYTPGRGMADAFGVWLERVFGDRGLVVYDASDSAAKPLAADVFVREISTAGRTAALATSAGAALEARGYHVQVHAQPDSLALFRIDGARRTIRSSDDSFLVGDQVFP